MSKKLHKIPRVDLAVCSAEQKVAYNLAFAYSDTFRAEFSKVDTTDPEAATQACVEIAERWYRQGYDYEPDRYNEEQIFNALRAGLPKYLEKPFIATDYKAIGAAFPITIKEENLA